MDDATTQPPIKAERNGVKRNVDVNSFPKEEIKGRYTQN